MLNNIMLIRLLTLFITLILMSSSLSAQDNPTDDLYSYQDIVNLADTISPEERGLLTPIILTALDAKPSSLTNRQRINLNIILGNLYTAASYVEGLKAIADTFAMYQKTDSANPYLPGLIADFRERALQARKRRNPLLSEMTGTWISGEVVNDLCYPHLTVRIYEDNDTLKVSLSGSPTNPYWGVLDGDHPYPFSNNTTKDIHVSLKKGNLISWHGGGSTKHGNAALAAGISIASEQFTRNLTQSIAYRNRHSNSAKSALAQGTTELAGMLGQALALYLSTSYQYTDLITLEMNPVMSGIIDSKFSYHRRKISSRGKDMADSTHFHVTLFKVDTLGKTPFIDGDIKKQWKKDSVELKAKNLRPELLELLRTKGNFKNSEEIAIHNRNIYDRLQQKYDSFDIDSIPINPNTVLPYTWTLIDGPNRLSSINQGMPYKWNGQSCMFLGTWKAEDGCWLSEFPMQNWDNAIQFRRRIIGALNPDKPYNDKPWDEGENEDEIYIVYTKGNLSRLKPDKLHLHFGRLVFHDYKKVNGTFIYEGSFENDKWNGEGKVYQVADNGEEILIEEGIYKNNKLTSK